MFVTNYTVFKDIVEEQQKANQFHNQIVLII